MNMQISRYKACNFVLAALLLGASLELILDAQVQASGARIAGKVVSSVSGEPLSRARVTIANLQERGETKSLITGDDGTFEFRGLTAGKYSLSAARRGFIESSFDQHERYSTAIVTGSEADSEHLVFRLSPQAVLTGRVLDEFGDPVRNANVSLYRQDQSTGVSLILRISSTHTDDRGIYEFAGLAAGNYFVSVSAEPWYGLRPRPLPNAGGAAATSPGPSPSFDVAYPTTYYPDATDSDDAVPVPLRGGERLTADVHLSPVPAIRFFVPMPETPEQGLAMPAVLRKSFDSMENVLAARMEVRSDSPQEAPGADIALAAPGKLEISGIPAGKYTVFIPDDATGTTPGTLAEINLTRDGQELNAASGEPVSRLKFAVHIPGEARIPERLRLALQNGDHRVIVSSLVDANGNSEFVHIPPGKYNLLAATPGKDYAVTQITSGGHRSNGHSLDIVPGSTIKGDVTLLSGTGTIEGFAKRAGKGVPGAMIVLVPKDAEAHGELFRRDQSDLDGSFSLATIVPGEYTIVAIENGWDLNWSQAGVIAHYLPRGRTVAVGSGLSHLPEPVEVQTK
jgi:protocatechuate 3,4-dioxygenase beta subunit